jgi:hypothetical protein
MREFGRVMSGHFNQLATTDEKSKPNNNENNPQNNPKNDPKNNPKNTDSNNKTDQIISKITEIDIDSVKSKRNGMNIDASGHGVLQAEAIKRNRLVYICLYVYVYIHIYMYP